MAEEIEANEQAAEPKEGLNNGDLDPIPAAPAEGARVESLTPASPAGLASVSRSAAEALQAAAGQITRERGADAGDAAALAEALRAFLDAFAGQNAPTRAEFRSLAARLDRLSSQFQKGR